MFRCILYFGPSESNYTPVVDDDDDAHYTSATTNDKINNDNQHDVAWQSSETKQQQPHCHHKYDIFVMVAATPAPPLST